MIEMGVGEDTLREGSKMQEAGGVMLVCSGEDILGKGGAELWQALYDIGWAFGKARTAELELQWWDENGDWREGDGGGGFLRSESFTTEEALFLRNI